MKVNETVRDILAECTVEGNLLKQNQEVKIKDSCFEF